MIVLSNHQTKYQEEHLRKLDSLATKVAIEKKIIKEGEDIQAVYKNLARNMAQIEPVDTRDEWTSRFFSMLSDGYFLPNYPCLRHGATEDGNINACMSACFVLGIEDSRTSIFGTLADAAEVQAMGGGTGFNFSKLREQGSTVRKTNGIASGPVSYMKVYDHALGDTIRQGSIRAGANMGILEYDHPDILKFISCKADKKTLPNFNLSVLVTDEFMQKAKKGEDYPLISRLTGEPIKEINAGHVLDAIAENAINNGCPGVLFYDNANKNNPFDKPLTATNPCGESFLYEEGEACILGSINLKHIVQDHMSDDDFDLLVESSVRFLDNVIDLNKYPLQYMRDTALKYRKIGLGFMGVADVLYMKKLSYASEEGRDYIMSWYMKLQKAAVATSEKLAIEKEPFLAFEESSFTTPRRNSYLTIQAPTGTLSILGGCSPGIEPWFGLHQINRTEKGTKLESVNPILQKYLKNKKLWNSKLLDDIKHNNGSIRDIGSIPQNIQDIFVTAHDIHFKDHIAMQAAAQEILDNSISKTINFPREATMEEARDAIILAHHTGCKGITIYRDGSKDDQPLTANGTPPEKSKTLKSERPKILSGQTETVNLGMCGKLCVTINAVDGKIREVILNKGSSGGCTNATMEAIGRLVTLTLAHGTPVGAIIHQLEQIKCDQVCYDAPGDGDKSDKITSCPMAAALAIQRFIARNKLGKLTHGKMTKCPTCGEFSIIKDGSCEYCTAGCGYSIC
jgi:ribonucleoside-diphosphate reductase alpha chain